MTNPGLSVGSVDPSNCVSLRKKLKWKQQHRKSIADCCHTCACWQKNKTQILWIDSLYNLECCHHVIWYARGLHDQTTRLFTALKTNRTESHRWKRWLAVPHETALDVFSNTAFWFWRQPEMINACGLGYAQWKKVVAVGVISSNNFWGTQKFDKGTKAMTKLYEMKQIVGGKAD